MTSSCHGPAATPVVRPAHLGDLPALYRVCLLTGDAGADASHLHRDPDLIGHVWCGPYVVADPGLAFVVLDAYGVAGYVIGTADSRAFADWCEARWWPALRERYPLTGPAADADTPAGAWLRRNLHHPARQEVPDAVHAAYPAALHIDLLPRVQGSGMGRALMERLLATLAARGVPGVHLGVSSRNPGAIAFYERMGFTTAEQDEAGRLMTRPTEGVVV